MSFIARYRKAQTNNIDPEVLHEVAASHSYLHSLQSAVSRAYKQLNKEHKVRVHPEPFSVFCHLR